MPHICTRCNNVFESGEDILKGCPVCGWKKFMFARSGILNKKDTQPEQLITQAMGVKKPPRSVAEGEDKEILPALSAASIQARPPRDQAPPKRAGGEKEKLESIKITAPGTYELNLPSLFEREELIMAVKDGTYFIDLSSAFKKGKKE